MFLCLSKLKWVFLYFRISLCAKWRLELLCILDISFVSVVLGKIDRLQLSKCICTRTGSCIIYGYFYHPCCILFRIQEPGLGVMASVLLLWFWYKNIIIHSYIYSIQLPCIDIFIFSFLNLLYIFLPISIPNIAM